MADLTVDYATLEHSEQSLQRIATELDGADAHRDATAGIWGSSHAASVGEMCASAKEAFVGADHQLAHAVEHARSMGRHDAERIGDAIDDDVADSRWDKIKNWIHRTTSLGSGGPRGERAQPRP